MSLVCFGVIAKQLVYWENEHSFSNITEMYY